MGMTEALIALYRRDLERFVAELEAYADESLLWQIAGDIKNPAGNLALHIVGNLNTFVGDVLGNTGYVRDRPAEFSRRDVPRAELVEQLRQTANMIERVLSSPELVSLEDPYPQEVLGYPMTNQYFLIHLYGHLNWHLGQVNYHRRLMLALGGP
jgi:hypothetical protein